MSEEKEKRINIEMADMVGKTYFQVAKWYNKDFDDDKKRQEALKHVSAEIIQQILEDAFCQIEGVKTGVKDIKNENETSTGTGKMFTSEKNPLLKPVNSEKKDEN